jgi:glycerol-3-phosphate acyltransferase PlsY
MLLNVILAFLIGSIPTGYLLTEFSGHGDIRKVGSGNIGATNVLRNSGKLLGLLTLLIDIGKGLLALVWLTDNRGYVASEEIFILGFSVVLGHVFSPWLKFKGGKGVATMLGVILFISMSCRDGSSYCEYFHSLDFDSNIFLISVFSWLMIIFITKYVALGSVISLIIATIYSFFYIPSLFLFFVLITLLITYKHKDNFERIKNKTEHKISF